MEPGDAVAFSFLTLHGAPGNVSETVRRRAFTARFVGDDAVFRDLGGLGSPPFRGPRSRGRRAAFGGPCSRSCIRRLPGPPEPPPGETGPGSRPGGGARGPPRRPPRHPAPSSAPSPAAWSRPPSAVSPAPDRPRGNHVPGGGPRSRFRGPGERPFPEAFAHRVEGPIELFVVLLARGIEEIELLGLPRAPFAKLERGDPDEADRYAEIELAEQRLGGLDDRPRRTGSGRQHGLPGVQPEVGGPELHPDAARGQPLVPHPARHGVRRAVEPRPDRRFADDVRVEGVLGADGLRLPLGDHRPSRPVPARARARGRRGCRASVRAHRGGVAATSPIVAMPRASRRSRVRGPTPQSRSIGNGCRNRVTSSGGTTVSPSGLPRSLATFATYLVVETPTETVSPVASNTAPRIDSPIARRLAGERLASRHVDERLVDAQGLDEGREGAEGAHHDTRDGAVPLETGREHDRVRAAAARRRHRHRAPHSVRPRLVARGGDHAARSGAADEQRLAAKLRRSSCSTAAKNASMSAWRMMRGQPEAMIGWWSRLRRGRRGARCAPSVAECPAAHPAWRPRARPCGPDRARFPRGRDARSRCVH